MKKHIKTIISGILCLTLVFGTSVQAMEMEPLQIDFDSVSEQSVDELLGDTYYVDYAFQVLDLVNQERAKAGLSSLKMDKGLYETAVLRAEEISRNFSHDRPNGSSCFTAFPSSQTYRGENIAGGQSTPNQVMYDANYGWMNSSGHKSNILSANFKSIGIACYYLPGSKYGYYWVQCFGNTVTSEIGQMAAGGSSVSAGDLAEPPSASVAPVATNNSSNAAIAYRTHVQSLGWQTTVVNGASSGTMGYAKRLEAIQIAVATKDDSDLGIRYCTHVQKIGWQDWKYDGAMSGTSGEAKRLEAIKIELTGTAASQYDVYYRVHAQTYGWLGWAKNGAPAGTAGQAKRLEAIQILIVNKGDIPDNGSVGYSYIELGKTANNSDKAGMINYMTHVQTYGNQSYVYDGSISGTTGESKRLEGICIKLNNDKIGLSGGIRYKTHVQTYGWLDWTSDGQFNGTSGEAKRLEAIQIELTGDVANYYDVYYRVHSQTYGWLGWAKNGEVSGTEGCSKRLEGIQIVLVKKNGSAPNSAPVTAGTPAYIKQ